MKIGILTFHAQLNYGGVLQAYALQQVLQRMGHDAVLVDRWLTPEHTEVLGPYKLYGLPNWVNYVMRGLLGCGQFARRRRYRKTCRLLNTYMRVTPYHFYEWSEMVGRPLGLDVLVVGSDQVWHVGDWGNPRPYLLEGCDEPVAAIAYAASFGMKKIPNAFYDLYKTGLARFRAIGVREQSGVEVVRTVGESAVQVLDPTQLLSASVWRTAFSVTAGASSRGLVCYVMGESPEALFPKLLAFAETENLPVTVFFDKGFLSIPTAIWWGVKRGLRAMRCCGPQVTLRFDAAPDDFLNALVNADCILSDSFHAVMFASVFHKNIRVLMPKNEVRRMMFDRIREFAQAYMSPNALSDSIDDALLSLREGETIIYDETKLAADRLRSWKWLKHALQAADRNA